MNDQFIEEMFDSLKKRINVNENKSYTAHLINKPEFLDVLCKIYFRLHLFFFLSYQTFLL
jgi:hypothetical protein